MESIDVMNSSQKKCAIVIPCYKTELDHNDRVALERCRSVLGEFDIYFIAPEGLKNPYFEKVPVKFFDDNCFSSRDAYSRFMLTPELYISFIEYEYILVYQLDAFVFRNELSMFCDLGFDYIGAPWPTGILVHTKEKSKVLRVGNGGLSLRKTKAFLDWIKRNSAKIESLINEYALGEDFVISFIEDLKIAPYDVAQKFSVELLDSLQSMQDEYLPFGSHNIASFNYEKARELYARYGFRYDKPETTLSVNMNPNDRYNREKRFYEDDYFDKNIVCCMRKMLPSYGEYAIWGTGKWGGLLYMLLSRSVFIKTLLETSPSQSEKFGCPLETAEEFLKNNKKKTGIIVAFKKCEEAERILQSYGYVHFKDYILFDDVFTWMDDELNKKIIKSNHCKKLLSVITVVKNGRKTIERALQSVILHKPDWCELIVIDGVSSDGTIEIINDNRECIDCFSSEPDLGIYDAMNKGIKIAHGEYVSFLNADDWYGKDALLKVEPFLREGFDIVYGGVLRMTEGVENGYIGSFGKMDPEQIYYTNLYCHQGMFIKREAFGIVGMYDISYKVYADYDWNIRAYERGIGVKTINCVVAYADDGGVSANLTWKKCKELIRVTERFSHGDTEQAKEIRRIHNNLITDLKYKYITSKRGDLLIDLLNARYEYYIWGTGKRFGECEALLSAIKLKICGCVDNNKKQSEIDGLRVYSPSEFQKKITGNKNRETCIIISTSKYEDEVQDQIRNWRIPGLHYETFSNVKEQIKRRINEIDLEKITMNGKSKSVLTNEYINRWFMLKLMDDVSFVNYLKNRGINKVALYGYTMLCRHLLTELYGRGINIPFLIDKRAHNIESRIPVYTLEEIDEMKNGLIDAVIVCIPAYEEEFVETAKTKIKAPIIDFEELIYEL